MNVLDRVFAATLGFELLLAAWETHIQRGHLDRSRFVAVVAQRSQRFQVVQLKLTSFVLRPPR